MDKKPDFVEEEHLKFLDDLRESGETNMFGAAAYLRNEFTITRQTASKILAYWMKTFGERQNEQKK